MQGGGGFALLKLGAQGIPACTLISEQRLEGNPARELLTVVFQTRKPSPETFAPAQVLSYFVFTFLSRS